MTRVISIISLGEGTGKTTLALNLGMTLHNMNSRVLVFDTDFTKHNMLEHLDIHTLPVTIGDVMEGKSHINDAIYRHTTGLRILPSMIHGYTDLSYMQDLLGDYDFILLDTPKEPEHLNILLRNSDEAIIIHNPKYSSKLVKDAIDLLRRCRLANLGIVLNEAVEESVDEIFGVPVLIKIQSDKNIAKSFELNNPVVHTHPNSEASKKFNRLAEKIN